MSRALLVGVIKRTQRREATAGPARVHGVDRLRAALLVRHGERAIASRRLRSPAALNTAPAAVAAVAPAVHAALRSVHARHRRWCARFLCAPSAERAPYAVRRRVVE